MILAAIALALQPGQPVGPPLDPQTMIDGFRTTCVQHLDDLDALRGAIRRSPLGFTRAADAGRWEIYRAESATIRIFPGEGCALDARLRSRADGSRVIGNAYAALGMESPPGRVNRGGTGAIHVSRESDAGGRLGLTASLDWHSLGAPEGSPVLVSLWVFRRSAP